MVETTQVIGNGGVASYSNMTVRYKGNDVCIDSLPRGTMFYLHNMTTGKMSIDSFAFGRRENIAERLGEEYRKNMWCADDKVNVIKKSELENILKLMELLRGVLH